jgi:hypothetical protein
MLFEMHLVRFETLKDTTVLIQREKAMEPPIKAILIGEMIKGMESII